MVDARTIKGTKENMQYNIEAKLLTRLNREQYLEMGYEIKDASPLSIARVLGLKITEVYGYKTCFYVECHWRDIFDHSKILTNKDAACPHPREFVLAEPYELDFDTFSELVRLEKEEGVASFISAHAYPSLHYIGHTTPVILLKKIK